MDEGQIKELIQSSRSRLKRGWLCPNDSRLADYVVGQLDPKKRESLESHAAKCAPCMSTLAFLAQSAEWQVSEEVPASLLYKAKNLVSKSSATRWPQRWALASALAACVALVFLLIVVRFRSETLPTNPGVADLVAQNQPSQLPTATAAPLAELPRPRTSTSTPKPKVRQVTNPAERGADSSLLPSLLSPREGTVLKRTQVLFSWKAVPETVSYEVKIARDDGSLVSTDRTNERQLMLSADNLKAGKYFVTIIAHFPDGRSTRSKIVSFRLTGP